MRNLLLSVALAVVSLAADAGYRRGDLLWTGGLEESGRAAGVWAAKEGSDGRGALHFVGKGPNAGSRMVSLEIDAAKVAGRRVFVEARVRGTDLQPGTRHFHGPKVMLAYVCADGRKGFPQVPAEFGSFDWKTWVLVTQIPKGVVKARLVLGVECAGGELWVDEAHVYEAVELPPGVKPAAPPNPQADAIPRGPYAAAPRKGGWRGVMSPGREMTEDDFRTLKAWNANLIRLQVQLPKAARSGTDEEYLAALDAKLPMIDRTFALCRKYGMKAVLDLHAGPTEANNLMGNTIRADFRTGLLAAAWRKLAARYRDEPCVYGYDILNEPATSPEKWDVIFRAVVAEIRKIDPKTPVITESKLDFYPDENVIYSPHFYSPHALTHFGVGANRIRWSYNDYINGVFWNRDQIRLALKPWIDFQRRHPGVRLFVGEFSCNLWVDGSAEWIADAIAIFEEYGWDWTYHAFREWPPWDVEKECDPGAEPKCRLIRDAASDTDRKRALLAGLSRNPKS